MPSSLYRLLILTLTILLSAAWWEVDAAEASATSPFTLMLDAGHGGNDPGALGDSIQEKTINFAVTKKIGEIAKKKLKGVKILYTRNNDTFVSLGDRCRMANRNNVDLFLSIHCDSHESNRQACGSTVYVPMAKLIFDPAAAKAKKESSDSTAATEPAVKRQVDPAAERAISESRRLASLIEKELVKTGGRTSRGVKEGDFQVIQYTKMPAVLVELDFICNSEQENYLASAEGQTQLATAICNALESYIASRPATANSKAATPTKKESSKTTPKKSAENNTVDQQKRIDSKKATDSKKTTDDKKATDSKKTSDSKKATETAKAKTTKADTTKESPIIYKIQILVSPKIIPEGSAALKHLSPVEYYEDNKMYKYTFGASTSESEIRKILIDVKKLFPDAFIIKVKDGIRIKN